jgi:DNA-binding transcriptional MocR family regulator
VRVRPPAEALGGALHATEAADAAPQQVSIAELAFRVLSDSASPDLIQLGCAIAGPELMPSEKMARILGDMARRHKEKSHIYAPPGGCESLRSAVARRLMESGCALSPDEIVVTAGCQEAIHLCLQVLCQPGDAVAVESPTYYYFLQLIESMGLRAVEIPTHPREGMSLDALAYALENTSIKAVLATPNFNNPLGSLMSDEGKRALVELTARHGVPLIEDDIYGELPFAAQRARTAKSFDRSGLVLHCSSVSKTLSPGFRVGWVAPGRFQSRLERLKATQNIATATLPQLAVAEFLKNGGYDRHLRRLRATLQENMAALSWEVERHFPEGTRLTRPQGGFVLWVELPEGVDALALYARAVAAGITLAPGPLFSAKQRYRNCIRLNAGTWNERTAGAVAVLGRLVREGGSVKAI